MYIRYPVEVYLVAVCEKYSLNAAGTSALPTLSTALAASLWR